MAKTTKTKSPRNAQRLRDEDQRQRHYQQMEDDFKAWAEKYQKPFVMALAADRKGVLSIVIGPENWIVAAFEQAVDRAMLGLRLAIEAGVQDIAKTIQTAHRHPERLRPAEETPEVQDQKPN